METMLDLKALMRIVFKYKFLIIFITVCSAVAAFLYTTLIIQPQYISEAQLLISNDINSDGFLDMNDINSAQKLAQQSASLLKSNTIMKQIINELNLDYSQSALKEMITLSNVNNTSVINITVKCGDPAKAAAIADKFLAIAPAEYYRLLDSGSITVSNQASYNDNPVSPNKLINTFIGIFMGFTLSLFLVLLLEKFDNTLKAEDDLSDIYGIPVYAEIIDFNVRKKKRD
ncbi:MAG: YveK family protein [Christensenellales bacterium]